MITGKELFGEIKQKKKINIFVLSRRSIFSESSLGALWDHDTNDASYMCAYPESRSFPEVWCYVPSPILPFFPMTLLDVTGGVFFFLLFLSRF